MSDVELKPCPFCGGSKFSTGGDDEYRQYWVECNRCEIVCESEYSVDDAIARWNRRAPDDRAAPPADEREAERLDWRDASIALENAGCVGGSRLAQVQELVAQRDAAVRRMRQLEDERQQRDKPADDRAALGDRLIAWAAQHDNAYACEGYTVPFCIFCEALEGHKDDCLHLRARRLQEGE